MTEYKRYPAIDDNDNFPPNIREAMASSREMSKHFAQKGVEGSLQQLGVQVDSLTADPTNSVTSVFIQAKEFDVVAGGVTYTTVTSRLGAYGLVNGVSGFVSKLLRVPSHWTKMVVRVVWVNPAANNGSISFGAAVHQWTIGDTINSAPSGYSIITEANPVPWVANETMIGTIKTPLIIDPQKFVSLRIERNGASTNDTLPNAIHILGVILEKVA